MCKMGDIIVIDEYMSKLLKLILDLDKKGKLKEIVSNLWLTINNL